MATLVECRLLAALSVCRLVQAALLRCPVEVVGPTLLAAPSAFSARVAMLPSRLRMVPAAARWVCPLVMLRAVRVAPSRLPVVRLRAVALAPFLCLLGLAMALLAL